MFHCQIERCTEWCFKRSVQGPVFFSVFLNHLDDRKKKIFRTVRGIARMLEDWRRIQIVFNKLKKQ